MKLGGRSTAQSKQNNKRVQGKTFGFRNRRKRGAENGGDPNPNPSTVEESDTSAAFPAVEVRDDDSAGRVGTANQYSVSEFPKQQQSTTATQRRKKKGALQKMREKEAREKKRAEERMKDAKKDEAAAATTTSTKVEAGGWFESLTEGILKAPLVVSTLDGFGSATCGADSNAADASKEDAVLTPRASNTIPKADGKSLAAFDDDAVEEEATLKKNTATVAVEKKPSTTGIGADNKVVVSKTTATSQKPSTAPSKKTATPRAASVPTKTASSTTITSVPPSTKASDTPTSTTVAVKKELNKSPHRSARSMLTKSASNESTANEADDNSAAAPSIGEKVKQQQGSAVIDYRAMAEERFLSKVDGCLPQQSCFANDSFMTTVTSDENSVVIDENSSSDSASSPVASTNLNLGDDVRSRAHYDPMNIDMVVLTPLNMSDANESGFSFDKVASMIPDCHQWFGKNDLEKQLLQEEEEDEIEASESKVSSLDEDESCNDTSTYEGSDAVDDDSFTNRSGTDNESYTDGTFDVETDEDTDEEPQYEASFLTRFIK
jgi:hypothetical protein